MLFNCCNHKGIFSKITVIMLSIILAACVFLVSGCGGREHIPQTTPTPTATAEPTPSPSPTIEPIVKNGNFEDFYETSFPKTPKNWTSYGDSFGGKTASLSKSKYGIISIEDESYTENKEKYGGIDNPLTPHADDDETEEDDYIIMLYNEEPSAIKYRSQSITMPQNAYAKISLYVKTVGISSSDDASGDYQNFGATINISGISEPVYINGIDTVETWQLFEFYLEGAASSKTFYIELGLGSGSPDAMWGYTKGHAFFDAIEMEFISKSDYHSALIDKDIIETDLNGPVYTSDNDNYFYADTNKYNVNPYLKNRIDIEGGPERFFAYSFLNIVNIETTAFEDELPTEADIEGEFFNDLDDDFDVEKGTATVGGDKFEQDLANYPFTSSSVYYINNKNAATQGIKSAPITLTYYEAPANPADVQLSYSHYRISVFVKTSDFQNNGLNIGLFNNGDEDIKPTWFENINTAKNMLTEEQLELAANRHNKWSGWTEYVFYVESNPFYDVDVHLEFWLGPKNVQNKLPVSFTKGYALISEYSVQKLTSSEYSAASSGDTVKTGIKLYTSSGTPGIANSGFNAYSDKSISERAVYPNSWTGYYGGYNQLGGNEDKQMVSSYGVTYGIINKYYLNDYAFKDDLILTDEQLYPDDVPVSQPNCLMIFNSDNTSYGFVSQSRTMSAESYYKISVWVRTLNGAKAYIYLTNEDGVLTRQEDDDSDPEFLQFEDITANEWTQYQFYVQTGELSKGFSLEIWNGSRDGENLSQGIVLFDDAMMLTRTEDSFEEADDAEINIAKFVFEGIDIAPEETPEPTTEPTPTPEPEEEDRTFVFPWGLVTTSVIAFVLLFVMVMLFIRKMKSSKVFKPKKIKVVTPSYSRDKIKTVTSKGKGKKIRVEEEYQPESDTDEADDYGEYDTINYEQENQEMQEIEDEESEQDEDNISEQDEGNSEDDN